MFLRDELVALVEVDGETHYKQNQPTTSTQGQAEGISLHAALPAAYVSHAIGPDHGYRVARCRESPGAVDGEGPLQEGKVYQIIVAVLFLN